MTKETGVLAVDYNFLKFQKLIKIRIPTFHTSANSKLYNVQVVKRMWAYIKENKLQDPKNKQMIKCDEKLSKIVPTKKFRGFGMTKYLKEHMNVGADCKPKKKAKKVDSDEDSEDEAVSGGSGSGSE